ncbi:MAG: tetraacyldisaccharide 4'-kinase [Desulfarculus sp.]|nr:MAG: tetraacyldisaccharide 4'-kinase [Desulfarculus sp.]
MTAPEPGPCWLEALRAGAAAASGLYAAGVWLNNTAFDLGLRAMRRLPAPVIGVGNLEVGGTGKTPLVLEVVASLERLGLPAGVISRGYGRRGHGEVVWVSEGSEVMTEAARAGDEPLLLARRLQVPVAVGADRYAVGRALLERCGPRVLVADDLFQHRALHRDLNLLCLDAADPLASGRLLPRGRLREPAGALARADAVVLTRAQDPEQVERARHLLAWRLEERPLLACRYYVRELVDRQGQVVDRARAGGLAVAGFCGLARPESFRASLEGLGLKLALFQVFADHHRFRPAEIRELWQRARRAGAWALVCSEKDAMRLPAGLEAEAAILYTRLCLEFWGGHAMLDDLLRRALAGWGGAR